MGFSFSRNSFCLVFFVMPINDGCQVSGVSQAAGLKNGQSNRSRNKKKRMSNIE
jgi:hypothetical protein